MGSEDSTSFIKSIIEEHSILFEDKNEYVTELKELIKKYNTIELNNEDRLIVKNLIKEFHERINCKGYFLFYATISIGLLGVLWVILSL